MHKPSEISFTDTHYQCFDWNCIFRGYEASRYLLICIIEYWNGQIIAKLLNLAYSGGGSLWSSSVGVGPLTQIDGGHYNGVIISAMAFQITSFSTICPTACSGADQRKHQSSASLSIVRGIHGGGDIPLTHKVPVTLKMFPFDDVTRNRNTWDSFHTSSMCLLFALSFMIMT